MVSLKKIRCFGFLVFAAAACFISANAKADADYSKAPFYSATGKAVTTETFKGKPLIVFMYKKTCALCRAMLPSLDAFNKENPDIQVVAVMFESPTLHEARGIFTEQDIRTLAIYLDKNGLFSEAAGVQVSPLTILIDADGNEKERIKGKIAWSGPVFNARLKALTNTDNNKGIK